MTEEVKKDDITENFVIDRQPVPLAYCAHPTAEKSSPDSTPKPDVFGEIMEIIDPITVENPGEIRKAESIKSYGCETESEFEFSGDDSDLEDLHELKANAVDSDDEFDKLVHLSAKIIEKTHKSEYPDENGGVRKSKKSQKAQKTPNIREYDDLPPLENLSIECRSNLIEFGFVSKVVDCMVVIESTSTVVLDFDSFLFDQSGKAVGQIYDIFGQVKSPQYAIRFNSSEEAHLTPINMKVYYAPNEEQFSKTPFKGLNLAAVNRESIQKMNRQLDEQEAIQKAADTLMSADIGSDVEFSDDEAEKAFRNTRSSAGSNQNRSRNDRGGRKRDRRGAHTVRFALHNSWAPNAPNAPHAPPAADFSNPYAEFGCYPTFSRRFGN